MILNTIGLGKNGPKELAATEVHRIDLTSNSLVKTASDTAKFKYKVSNHYYKNITNEIPQSDIDAYAVIGPSIYYHVFNKYGKDITKDIPLSQLAVCSSENCIINLSYLSGMGKYNECVINYNNRNNDRTIILILMDRLSGVKSSINIGDQPKDVSINGNEDTKENNNIKKQNTALR